jgi:hypothetical protein
MPELLTPYAVLVWLLVGFFTGVGWALGHKLVGRFVR